MARQTETQLDQYSPEDLKRISDSLEGKPPAEVLRWALERFHPDIALACSFGAEDVALVDMVVRIQPDARIFYLDTDFLFAETYELRDRVLQKYSIQPIRAVPSLSPQDQATIYGPELWARDANLCCNIRKVQPLTTVLSSLRAWITGIRRDQAPSRANSGIVEWDGKFQLVKVNPLAAWAWDDVWRYIQDNGVPYNVLHDRGYPSIGCTYCSRPVKPGEDPRAGRWSGSDKTECGLHK